MIQVGQSVTVSHEMEHKLLFLSQSTNIDSFSLFIHSLTSISLIFYFTVGIIKVYTSLCEQLETKTQRLSMDMYNSLRSCLQAISFAIESKLYCKLWSQNNSLHASTTHSCAFVNKCHCNLMKETKLVFSPCILLQFVNFNLWGLFTMLAVLRCIRVRLVVVVFVCILFRCTIKRNTFTNKNNLKSKYHVFT